MNIKDFQEKYKKSELFDINNIANKWRTEKLTKDFLGSPIATGVIVSDIFLNGAQMNHAPPEVLEAFKSLMGTKADSIEEIQALIIKTYEKSPQSLQGLISKIQGQYGENIFKENIGQGAELASSGSQKGWDIKIPREGIDEHIQVKVYNDSSGVIEKIKEVNAQIQNGEIKDVTQINFAVNSDIYEEVTLKAEELELPNKIYNIGRDHSEIRGALENGIDAIKNGSLLENFFSEVLGIAGSAAAIHAASNAFLVWKYNKEISQAIEDTIYSSAISSGGIVASIGTRMIIAETIAMTKLEIVGSLLGPVGFATSIAVGYGTRAYLKRIISRKDISKRIVEDFQYNEQLCLRLKSAKFKMIA